MLILLLIVGETIQYSNLCCISAWRGHSGPAWRDENEGR